MLKGEKRTALKWESQSEIPSVLLNCLGAAMVRGACNQSAQAIDEGQRSPGRG